MAEDAFQKSFSTKPKTDTVQSTGENNANNTNTANTADTNSAASATSASAVTSTHNDGNSEAAAANNAKSVQSKGAARGRSELDVKVAKIGRDGAQNEN